MPERFRALFEHPFNRMQEEVIDAMLSKDDNIVLSAPTGAGMLQIIVPHQPIIPYR